MVPAQRFFGYDASGDNPGTVVDIIGDLTLATEQGDLLPALRVRMVPGQVDDLLVSASDLDFLGFDAVSESDMFLLTLIGLSVPRKVANQY